MNTWVYNWVYTIAPAHLLKTPATTHCLLTHWATSHGGYVVLQVRGVQAAKAAAIPCGLSSSLDRGLIDHLN